MSPKLRGGEHIDFDVDLFGSAFALTLVLHFLACTVSCELVAGCLLNFQGYIIEA